jgi:peptidase C25-like protein
MRIASLFALILIVLVLPATADEWIALTQGAQPDTPPAVRTVSQTRLNTVLEVSVPGFWAVETPQGWQLRLPEGLISMVEGRPELPFVGCTVAMPAQGTPILMMQSADFTLPRALRVRMAPRPELEGEINVSPPPAEPNTPFPTSQAMVVHSGLWRNLPLASLQVYPFQANGDGTLTGVASRLVVEVVYQNVPAVWEPVTVSDRFRAAAEASVANFKFVPTVAEEPNQMDAGATEYLVVANTPLASGVTNLINWRKRQGYETELVTTTSTSPSTIKSLIQTRYAAGKLKYVVLVGDYAQIPYYSWSGTYSDMWYACLTGGSSPDLYPDVGLGRLSGTTTSMISHQVAKILKYEQNPPSGSWFTKTILAAHREQAPGKYVGCKQAIADGCLKTSGWTTIKQFGNDPAVYNSTVTNYINAGVGLVNYRGHGGTTSWASGWNTHSGGYTTTIVNGLNNGDMTPIVFNIACYNGNFKLSCLQEAWMQANDAAVASLGAIQPSYTTPNHDYDKTLYSAIFCDGLTNIYDFYYKATQKIISMGSSGQSNAKMYWWGGDAATCLWGRVPYTLTVTHASSINTGSQNVQVTVRRGTVNVAGAMVCLYKGTEVYAVGTTSSTGVATLSVNPTSTGSMLVTVTAKDCRPYLGSLSVTTASGNMIALPAFGRTYSGSMTRGLYCRAPCDFTVVGLRVPDEASHGKQNVCLYKHTSAPPAYSGTVALTPLFSKFGEPSASIIPCSISFKTGDYLIAIGACGDASGLKNSYAATTGPFLSSVLGQPTSLYRCGIQANICTLAAPHPVWSENAGSVSRVEIYIKGPSGFICNAPSSASLGSASAIKLSGGPIARTVYYQIAASMGNRTRIDVGPCSIYLNVDPVFVYSLLAGPPIFNSYAGILTLGQGTGKFVPPVIPQLVGLYIYHAAVSFDASKVLGCTATDKTLLTK